MLAFQRKGGIRMVEGYLAPPGSGMAGRTILTKLALMLVIFRMTTITILRYTNILTSLMTGCTIDIQMFSGQFESSSRMIECRWTPTSRGVTSRAILTKLSFVIIIFHMAAIAILRGALEKVIRVTGLARYRSVLPSEFEGCGVMVKIYSFPINRRMAGGAILAEFTLVWIIFTMTGKTILRCALEEIILMAFFTINRNMFPGQGEYRFRMIEIDLLPINRCMAIRTGLP